MADKADADRRRIKRLQALCDQLDTLRKQADEICKVASAEIRRAERSGQRERRTTTRKVRRERRG